MPDDRSDETGEWIVRVRRTRAAPNWVTRSSTTTAMNSSKCSTS
jgi:hypothetical protein